LPVSGAARAWAVRIGWALAIAAAVHAVAVWAVPRAIMNRVFVGLGGGTGAVQRPPPADAAARRIVLPSPDLLYAVCAYDVSDAPLRVTADPKSPGYWSIALYASSSDNFHVLNDRQAEGRAVDWVVVGPRPYARAPSVPEGAALVTSPTVRGVLLMRVLVGDPATRLAQAETARGTLRCEPVR
jgi:uncharacterized membrane protein